MNDPTTRHMLRPSHRRRVFAAIFLTVSVGIAPTLVAGIGEIIFDPANFAKNVQQVVALLQQVARASEQIRQQGQMLAHLPASVADALALAGHSLNGQLSVSFPDPSIDAGNIGGQIESRYPINFPNAEPAWLETTRPGWMREQRQQLLHERDLAQHVHDQMTPTADRLRTIVEASNGVDATRWELPGQVAVAQAHEELLAICSGEADKILAVRTARGKRHAEARAHAQSESAYRAARRSDLMIDWNLIGQTPPEAIRNPF